MFSLVSRKFLAMRYIVLYSVWRKNVNLLAFGQFRDFLDHCAALLSTSSGYKPIFLDSMELVAIEQASIVYSGARTALERSAHVDHRHHQCRACTACCAVPTVAGGTPRRRHRRLLTEVGEHWVSATASVRSRPELLLPYKYKKKARSKQTKTI